MHYYFIFDIQFITLVNMLLEKQSPILSDGETV